MAAQSSTSSVQLPVDLREDVWSTIAGPSPRRQSAIEGQKRARRVRAAIERDNTTATMQKRELAGRAQTARDDDGSINPLCTCTGLLVMQVQLLRQSAAVEHCWTLTCSPLNRTRLHAASFLPLIVQMGALPAGRRPDISTAIDDTHSAQSPFLEACQRAAGLCLIATDLVSDEIPPAASASPRG